MNILSQKSEFITHFLRLSVAFVEVEIKKIKYCINSAYDLKKTSI
jgi:hypothetical protein